MDGLICSLEQLILSWYPGYWGLGPVFDQKTFGWDLSLINWIQSLCLWRPGWSFSISGSLVGSVSIFMMWPNVNTASVGLRSSNSVWFGVRKTLSIEALFSQSEMLTTHCKLRAHTMSALFVMYNHLLTPSTE